MWGLDKIFVLDDYGDVILGRRGGCWECGGIFYITVDRGKNWEKLDFSSFGEDVSLLSLKPTIRIYQEKNQWGETYDYRYLYASIKAKQGKAFLRTKVSRDKGYNNSWEKISEGAKVPDIFIFQYPIQQHSRIAGFVRMGEQYDLYLTKSIDDGKTWSISANPLPHEISFSILDSSDCSAPVLLPDPELENVLYVGTRDRGVLRIDINAKE